MRRTPPPPPPNLRAIGRSQYASSTLQLHDTGMRVASWHRAQNMRRQGGADLDIEGGGNSEPDMYSAIWSVKGQQVVIRPVNDDDAEMLWGPCGGRGAQQTLGVCTAIGVWFLVALAIVAIAIGWGYIYPNTIQLVDSKLDGVAGLVINLATANVPVVEEELTCIFGVVCNMVNNALAPILGENISCSFGNQTLGDICPFSFAGINHTVSSSQVSEALGSTWDTSAPPFTSQLRDLKYDTRAGSSSHSPDSLAYIGSSPSGDHDGNSPESGVYGH